MKLNNKGFLITGILYSLLLLFLVLIIGMISIVSARQTKLNYIEKNIITKLNDKYELNVVKVWDFDYTGDYQTFVVPTDGYYKVELWGAQGGGTEGGKGAYTKGTIYLTKGQELFVYVGGAGNNSNTGGYNGGGYVSITSNGTSYGYGGGGSTDVRIVGGSWNNFNSTKSRIMVAAGGGGANEWGQMISGGFAGTFVGGNGLSRYNGETVIGASQTAGGVAVVRSYSTGENGKFGSGGSNIADPYYYGGGGGSGYYGGAAGSNDDTDTDSGSGGSSFISGLQGCDAIAESSTEDNIIHTAQPNHYSGKVFSNAIMIAGNSEMPTHDGTDTMIGNTGNGYAKISLLKDNQSDKIIVNFDANGGKVDISGKEVAYGEVYGDLPTPTREGYTFKGWNGKNLLNYTSLIDYNNWSSELVINGEYPTRDGAKGYLLNLESDKTYTINYTTDGTEMGTYPRYLYLCKIVNNTGYLVSYLTTNVVYRTSYTFEVKSGEQYFLRVSDSNTEDNFNNYISKLSSIQLEEGNTATEYEPYYIKSTTTVVQNNNHTLTAIWEPNS